MMVLLKTGMSTRPPVEAGGQRHGKTGFSGAQGRPLLPGLNRLGIAPDGEFAQRREPGRGHDDGDGIRTGRRRTHAVNGSAKLARRFVILAQIMFEAVDEPERLHGKKQDSQNQTDGTATLEHGDRKKKRISNS
ncbi:MAG: hypothetical protein LBR05_00425 [Azoarcus sp.]|jgi:hypothetical protein|nr:hypothetical protein [Azoarcus sp.]